jgi:hypothetical protein
MKLRDYVIDRAQNMDRFRSLLLTGTMLACLAARADENLPVLKVGSDVYSNVTITSVTPTDIYFSYANGMGNAKLKNLEPALQEHFHYHGAKAATSTPKTSGPVPTAPTAGAPDLSDPKAMLDDAMERVRRIVNQPVTMIRRTPDMDVALYPGWFHPGAEVPDFNKVDVRTTQRSDYDVNEYVASEQNPNAVFRGRELEFNPMTKYFFTDRSLPKKKLTEAEMLEINRLYRIIGSCQAKIAASKPSQPDVDPRLASVIAFVTLHKAAMVVSSTGLMLLLGVIRLGRRQAA